jgi:hypothetical protein
METRRWGERETERHFLVSRSLLPPHPTAKWTATDCDGLRRTATAVRRTLSQFRRTLSLFYRTATAVYRSFVAPATRLKQAFCIANCDAKCDAVAVRRSPLKGVCVRRSRSRKPLFTDNQHNN